MPNSSLLQLFFHPTSTVLLDDDNQFFSDIRAKLPSQLNCQYFSNIDDALNRVKLSKSSYLPTTSDAASTTGQIHETLLHDPLLDEQRYQNVSVIVVDYDMPGIDGLEVCRQISNPFVKKILLTGVADEVIAVEALNEKVIDFYAQKNQTDISRLINAILRQQQAYFKDINRRYQGYSLPRYMRDKTFQRYFGEVCDQYAIDEFYFMEKPFGFLLLNQNGIRAILLAYNEEEMQAHQEVCEYHQAPAALITAIKTRQHVPFFSESKNFFYNNQQTAWQSYLHPTVKIMGQENYYCALIMNPNTQHLLPYYQRIFEKQSSSL